MTIKCGIIGATGYAGAELVRILLSHPGATLAAAGSQSFIGKKISEVYPNFYTLCDLVCEDNESVIQKSDVIFACVPHGISQKLAADCVNKGKKFIDLGADFRLHEEADYKEWYGLDYTNFELHDRAVYGLPELFFDKIAATDIIGNPGCYPTSIGLGLFPALKNGLVESDGIIIDSKSGVTGAGRAPSQTTHFPDCNEAFSPYKVASHRHTPEIEQTLSYAAGKDIKITFVPHLLPINRGILSTMYLKLTSDKDTVRRVYEDFYMDKPFVRILQDGDIANLRNVKYTNLCDISLHFDDRTNTLIVVSAIDNMVKGAAGQAIQNMNIMFSLPQDTGLKLVPPAF